MGLRPDIRLLVISQEPLVEQHLLSQMHQVSDYDGADAGAFQTEVQEVLEELHYKKFTAKRSEKSAAIGRAMWSMCCSNNSASCKILWRV